MAKVRVWNDNVHPYRETFKGEKVEIAAKSWILMEQDEAIMFRGTFAPIKTDGDGNPIAEGFKMIRVEAIPAEQPEAVKVDALVCQACTYKAASDADLLEHGKAKHSDILTTDEEAEAEIKVKRGRKTG